MLPTCCLGVNDLHLDALELKSSEATQNQNASNAEALLHRF